MISAEKTPIGDVAFIVGSKFTEKIVDENMPFRVIHRCG